MIISANRIKKILYYLKKGRINVFINALRLTFFNNNLNNNKLKFHSKKFNNEPLCFPLFKKTDVSERPFVSIIIPVYNQWNYTYICLKSVLENTKNISYEIIIADDNSSDETVNAKKYVKNIKITRNKNNLGFLKNCNNAAKYATGNYILFLNNDTEVQKNWLKNLLRIMETDESVGMVGPKFIYPNGVLIEAGGIIWKDGESWQYGRFDNPKRPEYNYIREVDYISGACILLKKELFNNIDGFDERYAPAYYEDTDLAFEVRKMGYKVIYQPESVITHYENITYKKSDSKNKYKSKNTNNIEMFKQKWKYVLENEHYEHMSNISNAKERTKHNA